MIALRHLESGEVQIVTSATGYGEGWETLPEPPALDGWAWDNTARAWVQRGKRLWRLTEFLTTLCTPAEVVAIETAPTSTPDGLLMRWAAIVTRTVETVNLDDANTQAFIALAVQNGIITPQRAARILSGLPPE